MAPLASRIFAFPVKVISDGKLKTRTGPEATVIPVVVVGSVGLIKLLQVPKLTVQLPASSKVIVKKV
jgi:hypothetical protein